MKTKIIPFDAKMAKDIQDGKIEGRVRTIGGDFTARIICFDKVKLVHGDGTTEKQIVSLIYNENAREDILLVHNQKGETQATFGWEHGYDLVLEVPDNESKGESKQNFKTVAESDAYAEGYENGFKAGRCVAFDDNKCMTLKTNELQFKPFDKVLGKSKNGEWVPDIYSHTCVTPLGRYICLGGIYDQIIPYEGNEHLLGTTDKPKEE